MKNIKVTNINGIPNQFEIRAKEGVYFQSYESIIAFIPNGNGRTQLDTTYWNYSRTTSKYRNIFLGEDTKETKQKIAEGNYMLTNLN